jgi:ABC-2 type transport system permease protein
MAVIVRVALTTGMVTGIGSSYLIVAVWGVAGAALIFVVLLFSPIVVPASHFPAWLFAVDRALPFYNMAEVIRAGLTSGLVTDLTRSCLILLAWTMAGWVMTTWVVGRRR